MNWTCSEHIGRKELCVIGLLLFSSITAMGQDYTSRLNECYSFIEKGDSTAFIKAYPHLYRAYLEENDPYYLVSHELIEMKEQDQSIRLLYLDASKRFAKEDARLAKIRGMMDSIDRENETRAVGIVQEYGWLTKEDVGEDAAEALFLIVQHCSDTDLQQNCLPKLKEAAAEDSSIAWQYAFLADRLAMNMGEPQTDGTQKIVVDGVPYPVPIKDVDGIDERRAEVGLPSLWEELNEEYGSDWSLEKYKENVAKIDEVFRNYRSKRQR